MRHPQWITRLPETLKNAINRPFVWGEHDCCLFASDCVIAVCNFDPANVFVGVIKQKLAHSECYKRVWNIGRSREPFLMKFNK